MDFETRKAVEVDPDAQRNLDAGNLNAAGRLVVPAGMRIALFYASELAQLTPEDFRAVDGSDTLPDLG